jgi:cell division protein FtsL
MSVFETFRPTWLSQTIEDFIEDVRPRLQVVPIPATKRLSTTKFGFVIVGMLAISLSIASVMNSYISENAYQIQSLNSEIADSRLQMQTLQQQLTVMTAPSTLHKRAKQLGMVPMPAPVFIDIETGEIFGKPTPAVDIKVEKSRVPTLDNSFLMLNPSGSAVIDPARVPIDDSAFLYRRGGE